MFRCNIFGVIMGMFFFYIIWSTHGLYLLRNVRIYFRRQASQASLQSTSSTRLADMPSRPVSIDSEENINDEQPTLINVSSSDTPPRHPSVAKLRNEIPRSSSVPNLLTRRPSFLDKMVCRIFDYLYMGDIESAYNANLLCCMNIGYIVDVSNVEPNKVPRNKRSDCPCLCSSPTAHSRVRMAISVDESSQIDLIPYFKDVNELISSAKSCNKSVLIHSFNGRNRCAVFAVQYLMTVRRTNLQTAEQSLRSMAPNFKITDNFYRSLKRWENMQSSMSNEKSDTAKSNTKSAWTWYFHTLIFKIKFYHFFLQLVFCTNQLYTAQLQSFVISLF